MDILFVHQNYPGQYREILPKLASLRKNRIVFLTQRRDLPKASDHAIVSYQPDHVPKRDAYRYTSWFESTCGNGIGAAKACAALKKSGFNPALVIGHIGWGELTFIKDVWPDAAVVGYFEYYFIPTGGCVAFDPEFREEPDIASLLHARNAMNYLSFMRCAAGHTATEWQKRTYPELFHAKIDVIHEGIRTDRLVPDHSSDIELPVADPPLRRGDEIVTYVARNLEPTRGFHIFMRALPAVLRARPKVRIVVVGGDKVSYGPRHATGETFRARLIRELGDSVDWSRIHFLGYIRYASLVQLLKISTCHVYLTMPFVVSWSMLEAMALEKIVVASDVASVRQFAEHGRNALLVDYFSPAKLAETIVDVLGNPDKYRPLAEAARRDVVANYDFNTVCYPAFLRLLTRVLPAARPHLEGDGTRV